MRDKTTILIADRECLFRRGLRVCLEIDQRFQVLSSVGTARDALTAAARTTPDVAMVGLNLPDFSGLALLPELQQLAPDLYTILVVDRLSHDILLAARSAGADAVLEKDATEAELLQMMRRVVAEDGVIDRQIHDHLATYSVPVGGFCSGESTGDQRCLPISRRELEILRGVSCGMTNAEIGELAEISVQTVKNHVTSILRKLAVHDRTQAVVLAIQQGWLDVGDLQVESRYSARTDEWQSLSSG